MKKLGTFPHIALGVVLIVAFSFSFSSLVHAQRDGTPEIRPIYGDRLRSRTKTKSNDNPNYVRYDDMFLPAAIVKSASPFRARRWTNGVLPISFQPSVTAQQRQAFMDTCLWWGATSNVVCQPRTNESDYVNVIPSNENTSYVGRIGGGQPLKLYNWNIPGIIAHEIGHALGLIHEHMRPDRDFYVRILYQNIQSGATHNFDRVDAEIFSYYDFESIMHYPRFAFSKNGQPTIEPINPADGAAMGQRDRLSRRDELAAMKMYGARNGGATYQMPNIVGKWLTHSTSLLRIDYGLNINVTSGPTQGKLIQWTICESEIQYPEIVTQSPPPGARISYGSTVNVTTIMRSDFRFYPPPKGMMCP